jgi:hypothetical protein
MGFKNCIGEELLNNRGTLMKIIDKHKYPYVEIEFQDEHKYKTKVHYENFKKRSVFNPYDKTVFGVGYVGVGKYKTKINQNDKTVMCNIWYAMLQRCYAEKYRNKYPAYEGCTICDEWLNFQNFCKWYEKNYYDVGEGRMHIDKDILVKGNKVYSPQTCVFVPQRINMLFIKKNRKVDPDLPNGINRCVGGFNASYNNKYLGIYKTLNDALYYYNIEKQLHINELAEEYKDRIPSKLYNALINWNQDIKVA